MATRRQQRVDALKARGFMPWEAQELSSVSNLKGPAMSQYMTERVDLMREYLWKRAQLLKSEGIKPRYDVKRSKTILGTRYNISRETTIRLCWSNRLYNQSGFRNYLKQWYEMKANQNPHYVVGYGPKKTGTWLRPGDFNPFARLEEIRKERRRAGLSDWETPRGKTPKRERLSDEGYEQTLEATKGKRSK